MTLTQQRKLFVFCIKVHFPRIRHFDFGGNFGSYINYYKSKTFLMPNETFIDYFVGLIISRLRRFFSIKWRPSWNLPQYYPACHY